MPVIKILTAQEARTTVLLRHPPDESESTGEIAEQNRKIFGEPLTPEQVVTRILQDVRMEGDQAVRKYTALLDGADLETFRVDAADIEAAVNRIPASLRSALQSSAERIRRFHERQPTGAWVHWDDEGGVGQLVRPLERVGLYVPGGSAPLASTLLMTAVPARVAGVEEVVVTTPVNREGQIDETILSAAHIAGVDEVYGIGGAQAIAAMAYGTESIRRVDKILGPGNLFVVLAKRQVYGVVDIDQLPGPTETLLIADDSASPVYAAADLCAQAEHDPLASALLITTSTSLAHAVAEALEEQIETLERSHIIRASLDRNGGIIIAKDLDEAIDLANAYAPEHLCLLIRDAWQYVGRIKHAGGIFVGEYSSEALGDYVTGPSHVMPTGGTARFSSPLNVMDFMKIISLFGINEQAAKKIGDTAISLAEAEGLTAHAEAIKKRMKGNG